MATKYGQTNSFSDKFEISDLSFAPTPPPHSHTRQRSSISSIGSRSTSQSKFGGSVIWNKSSSLPQLYDPGQTSITFGSSESDSSHLSCEPPSLTSRESSGVSWSTASSSFQTSSRISIDDSEVSQKPTSPESPNSSRLSFHRPLPDTPQASVFAPNTAMRTSTTLSAIPGYGPIRLTVAMDLPPPPHHHYQSGLYASLRVDTPTSEVPPAISSNASLDAALESYSATELRQLLRLAVQKHPSLASDLTLESAQQTPHKASKSVNFVHYSNSVWHTLNAKQHSDPNKEHQHANKAVQKIANDIHTITSQVHKSSSLTTKKNALETLRKIGRSVCLATGVVGETVKEVLSANTIFVDAIVQVAECFTEDDRRILWAGGSGMEIVKRLDQLDELRRCYCVFEGFENVLEVLKREDVEGGLYC
ncbi:hypothetical protein E4T44_07723 [Aureobasidium sp. EXF-8845]|nr:hypothetical protein E4T44_07723 [Aureobasidium sp. EXF-8845]KAI4845262.1 hypothetical protein E4T45_07798 [Aureobasidium sp. EXF-8846]